MKHLSLLKSMILTCGALATAAVFSSCSGITPPETAAEQIGDGTHVLVFSHNDMEKPTNRECREVGPLPDRTARALGMWLRKSTVKNFAYAYPQYYIAMADPRTGKQSAWGICSDGQGNLVGVLIPRRGVMAWDLPPVGNYKMYVCDTASRKGLSKAIMDSLAEAGYDSFRIESRKAKGLTQKRYLISKPLSDEAQKRYNKLKEMEEASQQAQKEGEASTETESEDSLDESLGDEVDDEGRGDVMDESEADNSSSDDSELDDDFGDLGDL